MNDSGEGRRPQAASVGHRWWENPAGNPAPIPTAGLWSPAGSAPPPLPAPPPPPPVSLPVAPAPASHSAIVLADQQRLVMELESSRAEVTALHEMLEDLPEIFERKFRQRIQGLVEDQQRLLNENQLLRDRLYALTPATPTAPQALRGEAEVRLAGLPIALPGRLRSALDGLRRRPAKSAVSLRPGAGQTRAA
jgi:hypothetical protein